jgi:hypothetical protein
MGTMNVMFAGRNGTNGGLVTLNTGCAKLAEAPPGLQPSTFVLNTTTPSNPRYPPTYTPGIT